jgi:hypothetical protein
MTMQARVLDAARELDQDAIEPAYRELPLASGRRLRVLGEQTADGPTERIEVLEADGALSLRLRLTDEGPVLVLEGARLELKGSRAIALAAPEIDIEADQLRLTSKGETRIRAEEDVRVVGRLIHLN